MFDCIIKFFTQKQDKTVFSQQYINGYKKLWINSLRNYRP
jgi:hypothetical protein